MLHSKKTEVGWKRNRLCFSQNKTFLKQRRFTTNLTAETPKTEQLDPLKKTEKISSRKPLREIISNIYVHEVLAGKKKEIIEVKENIMTFDAIRTMSQKKVGAIIVTKNEPKKERNGRNIF
jgi:hypothetical protein